jgi:rifampicin phosphotransferase
MDNLISPPVEAALRLEWNDTLSGEYLWTNVNFGEAVSEVMTPLTWSLLRRFRQEWSDLQRIPVFGNLGGRLYFNVSYIASAMKAVGKSQAEILVAMEDTLHMPVAEGMDIPVVPITKSKLLAYALSYTLEQVRWWSDAHSLPAFLAATPAWCRVKRQQINEITKPEDLGRLWKAELLPYCLHAYRGVLGSALRFTGYAAAIHQDLSELTDAQSADILLTNLSGGDEQLASLGPLIGLEKVVRAEMSRQAYLDSYAHRGPNEWELFTARPAEHPGWLDAKLREFHRSGVDISGLLAKQSQRHEWAWSQLADRFPGQVTKLRRRFDELARRARLRETARSELVRIIGVLRAWAIRAGELSGLGDGLFFLEKEEALAFLAGQSKPAARIAARRNMYDRLAALGPYPAVIIGQFDPFQWAARSTANGLADHAQACEIFDARRQINLALPETESIQGAAGSPGKVQGRARLILNLDQSDQLQAGEILVTSFTDIGWTPLFPRSAAIITDIGAALSHAAIVARELGIPAVVGCGNATRRIKTGDRLLVDGSQGTIKFLK